jgi:uncharacterized protein YndB with AHSA1/START domain
MPTATASRMIAAPAQDLWEVLSDPHHLPRWWPRVERVEAVDGPAFTEVLRSDRGRIVRADFLMLERDERELRLLWSQQIEGTPFARILVSSQTEVLLRPAGPPGESPTEVSVSLAQTLPGVFRRGGPASLPSGIRVPKESYGLFAHLGSPLVRRAAARTVKGALDGLERIAG